MAESKDETVEVIDESEDDDRDSSKNKIGGTITGEMSVMAKAASVYFDTYSSLHEASEGEKKHNSLVDFFNNTQKAHKAAWKYIVENSDVHKENERLAKKFLPESAIENLHNWLDDSDDSDDK